MQTVIGGIYPPTVLEGSGIILQPEGMTRSISVPTRSAITIFNKVSVLEHDFIKNELGLYSIVRVGSDKKARFGRIGSVKHGLRARSNGCVWEPGGKIRMFTDVINTCPVQYQSEQCPDAWWNDCLEAIFGPGNAVRDLMGTAEGMGMMMMILERLYQGIGNDLSGLYNYANHPDITTINTAGTYAADADEWADYFAQQTESGDCAGLITLIDALAAQGEQNFAGTIPAADFTNGAYTGDINDLLNSLVNSAKPELKSMATNGYRSGGRIAYPIILLTPALYQAYEDYLVTLGIGGGFQAAWNFYLTKVDGTMQPMPGVLKFKGMPVVRWDEVGTFDSIAGTTSHRAALVAPGGFGMAAEVEPLTQSIFSGLGLRMVQRLDPPYMGKVYFDTTFRWGAGIPDKDMIVHKSRIVLPS